MRYCFSSILKQEKLPIVLKSTGNWFHICGALTQKGFCPSSVFTEDMWVPKPQKGSYVWLSVRLGQVEGVPTNKRLPLFGNGKHTVDISLPSRKGKRVSLPSFNDCHEVYRLTNLKPTIYTLVSQFALLGGIIELNRMHRNISKIYKGKKPKQNKSMLSWHEMILLMCMGACFY